MEKRYIQTFETSESLQEALDNNELGKPYVAYLEDEQRIVWNEAPEPPAPVYSAMPLTFRIISGGTISWKTSNTAFTRTVQYSKDNGETWASITSSIAGEGITVDAGDKVQFIGDNAQYRDKKNKNASFNGTTARFKVEGNIMSLVDSTNFATATTLASSYTFSWLFVGCTGLTSAENLVLPATSLTQNCYSSMFQACGNLTGAPTELPATTLANYCYANMFADCTSLTTAPELPATTLASNCYAQMFGGCQGLTTAPALPATSLATGCYNNMFGDCTSLTTAPELPATTLVDSCYMYMFNDCSNLNYVTCLATNISATSCTSGWVDNVPTSAGTFVKHPNMSSWTRGDSGIPSGWTVIDATI